MDHAALFPRGRRKRREGGDKGEVERGKEGEVEGGTERENSPCVVEG